MKVRTGWWKVEGRGRNPLSGLDGRVRFSLYKFPVQMDDAAIQGGQRRLTGGSGPVVDSWWTIHTWWIVADLLLARNQ
jgi:hypothetical protein